MPIANPAWYAAVPEQFTRFGTLQFEGGQVANRIRQYLNSWITQLVVGYDINSLQGGGGFRKNGDTKSGSGSARK
jgi:hypothetical protein